MRIRPIHLLHSTVLLVVAVMLGFAGAFFADAAGTNRTYEALAAHRVAVPAHVVYCNGRPGMTRTRTGYWCSVRYSYADNNYSGTLPWADPKVELVDPRDPQYRMSEAIFRHGPVAITGDLIFGSLLLFGACAVTGTHQYHLYLRRRHARS
jgi:hypothetical protein